LDQWNALCIEEEFLFPICVLYVSNLGKSLVPIKILSQFSLKLLSRRMLATNNLACMT
jgi:hypothetical protein